MAKAKNDKEWAEAVRKAVHEYHEAEDEHGKVKKIRYLNVLAAKLVRAAQDGDMQAMKEVGDRLDGKPGQAVEHSGHVKVSKITEEFVTPDGQRYRTEDQDAPGLPTTH